MKLTTKQFAVSLICSLFITSLPIIADENDRDGITGGGIISNRSFTFSYNDVQIIGYNSNIIMEISSDNIEKVINELPSDTYLINYLNREGVVIQSLEYSK